MTFQFDPIRNKSGRICFHGASQGDDDIYVMINAYWEALPFKIQEGALEAWLKIVDTNLPSPHDFLDSGLPLQQLTYQVAPRSLISLASIKQEPFRIDIANP